MVSPEKTVKMSKERRNGRKRLGQRNFRPLYIEDSRMYVIKLPKIRKKVPRNRIFRNK